MRVVDVKCYGNDWWVVLYGQAVDHYVVSQTGHDNDVAAAVSLFGKAIDTGDKSYVQYAYDLKEMYGEN